MLSSQSMGDQLQVAPLALGKAQSDSFHHEHHRPIDTYARSHPYLQSEMTPPTTPNASQEDLAADAGPPVFHNFLRAFYPFNPTYAMTDSSITLPLNEGDVVLVHSIHTNGWADGTLLANGARGWLPTNYCEAYEPEEMRSLLNALLNFWDLLRSTLVSDSELFGNQEFMKGIIAGVRFLLQRTNCLNRESNTVQRSDLIRRCRKSLMSELSSLVKTAKRMQESQRGTLDPPEDVNNIVDEMILKAFRIVIKAVRFVDTLEEDRRLRAPPAVTVMDTVTEESYLPSTPPTADHQGSEAQSQEIGYALASPASDEAQPATAPEQADIAHAFPLPQNKRLSSFARPPTGSDSPQFSSRFSHGSLGHGNRQSSSMSHRVSLAGPSSCSRPNFLVSERLNRSHDAFLSQVGSFIGRLHLQSQSCPQLASAIKQCATTGGELLAVIDAVCAHSISSSAVLTQTRAAMFERIRDLVFAARDTLVHAAAEEDLIMPHQSNILLTSATGCVRAAGECIAKARVAIERVGDFEVDVGGSNLDIDLSVLDTATRERERKQSIATQSDTASVAESTRTTGSATPGPRHAHAPSLDKPLPDVPAMDISKEILPSNPSPPPSRPESQHSEKSPSKQTPASSTRPSLALPRLSTSLLSPEQQPSPMDGSNPDPEYNASSSFDSMVASSAGSSATYLSRDSEASMASQSSTRATSPDHALVPRTQPSMSELSAAASSTHTEEVDEVENRLMEKTYAHELMFNREGQVTGGTLPALVERLTIHEAAPDAIFVSTFYLTFRLFCPPTKLAETLIDRFEYVGESPHMAGPVRLRVYNAFKGWLETHWRDQTDREALTLIIPFAEGRLSQVLPAAGRRLLELANRVSGGGSLVPRLVSSMGKTNTAIAQHVPADTPIQPPSITKSQQNMLNSFKNGGNSPTILDFDPAELARQLTLKQMNVFCSILPEELLASQWMKNGGVDAPNVKAMSSLSTDLSNLVADTILQHSEIKKRAAVIKQWIKVANACLELHNYDGLMAIICSLNSSTITRLRKTWDIVSPKRKEMLRTLQKLVEPSQNNKVLRTRLHDHIPPCLPFLGMYLTDLTFVDIGNPATKQMSHGNETEDQRASGLTVVNFDKHTRTAKIIGELQRFQIPYRLTEVPDLQDWLSAQINRVRDGDQSNVQVIYYRKSLLLEPREATVPRTPTEPTPPTSTMVPSRGDLFGWMSRDRSNTSTPAQV
ncbi:Ras guanine nucleotide exchange factor A-like protein [Hapsidospora chrysogenum ATCC 11550]|uniref:Ras guanine nucleotide exchange factor A-like protein n=1 Tax=Hapsidospora chrysogenum (strain ATCC 11550 / CBS 779.69 / DSM 880 / IAM 14645 / JCM 23072 / IMI 49137) TaxID=857340 RepID=A0A086SXA0_HAPC1|nr:Ras guanine nucleotide exchange factor A-like protein [Hapsidospora chrysogenum ATCC 11550]